MPEFITNGGFVLWALAALSIYAAGLTILKAWQFKDANLFEREFIDEALAALKRGDRSGATRTLAGVRGPVARIMRVAMECAVKPDTSAHSREAEVLRVGNADLLYLESDLRGLEVTAAIAPLMGLFGTMLGLIHAFHAIAGAGGTVTAATLAGIIWKPLMAAAGGLAIAVPALAAYYLLHGIIGRVRVTMNDVSAQVLALDANEAKKPEQAEAGKERSQSYDTASLRLRSAPQMPESASLLATFGKVTN